jgi:glycosyltransferase involved in cell wall biosynthesis
VREGSTSGQGGTGEPRITIGITCYREGEWVRECWESVLAQTDDRWEAVLVMDGTDHQATREVFARLEHPRLRKVALPENAGPYPTRNKAFELTRTPYHLYLDGDDQLAPDAVALLLGAFERHPEAGIVYGDYALFREGSGEPIGHWRYPREVTADDYVEAQPIPAGSGYRKAVWEALGGFAAELARGNGDYDFMIGAAEAGFAAVHCGAAHYRYRAAREGRVSSSYERRYHETHARMVERHPRFFADPRRRERFLGLGEKRSAIACYAAGEHARAAALARAALGRGLYRDRELWSILLRASLPALPRRAIEAARGAVRGSSGGRAP